MPGIYQSRKGPRALGTVRFAEIEEKARQVLKDHPEAFWYAYGSAGTGGTCDANLRAFTKFAIVPRMLVNASPPNRSLEVTLFGTKYPAPVLVAPIGVQNIFHPDAEEASAAAAGRVGLPYLMSTASSRSIEIVARANGPGKPRWYQLYWPRTQEITLSLLSRAKAAGFSALIVTLDTMTVGWRPHDLAHAYLPFAHSVGCQVGRSDPVFMAKFGRKPIVEERPIFPYRPEQRDAEFAAGDEKAKEDVLLGREWLGEISSGTFRGWEDLELVRKNWEGPLILKGIQSVRDAEMALAHGADGIIVSNHGGRQVDGALPSLFALERIMRSEKIRKAQATGKLTILFDSGIRSGPDIVKALALGAQAVLLGRPWLYGMIAGGQAGAEQVLQHTISDLDTTMALSGLRTVSDVQGMGEEVVVRVDL
ncbi:FMN-dependent dehydrogenase [Schizophyllum amplum]|uniref:FMN-dependent dehydrogenase n=1 Tax=Schizophyllum amplum TaxID=97359 RepID=A0A550CRH6_9AGAR|nr:FMN-dependent dehydrogenase [Auriculariopsis ampla]